MLDTDTARKMLELDRTHPYRVITYSVFGKNTRYTRGVMRNIILLAETRHFDGWKLRVYYDHTVPN